MNLPGRLEPGANLVALEGTVTTDYSRAGTLRGTVRGTSPTRQRG
jgi:hypothetical protein